VSAEDGRIVAAAAHPEDAAAARARGLDHHRRGELPAAEAAYRAALRADPENLEALHYLGLCLHQAKRSDEGLPLLRRSVADGAANPTFLINLGGALRDTGANDEAIEVLGRAVALLPHSFEAHFNYGIALIEAGRGVEALPHCRRCVAARPKEARAHYNLGCALQLTGFYDAAEAAHREAVALAPGFADAHLNLGTALLIQRRLSEGFAEYEWRGQIKLTPVRRRSFPQPEWNGRATDRPIVVYGEQGLGDEILFGRQIAAARRRAPGLILECDSRLVPLFARAAPGLEVVARSEPPAERLLAPDIAAVAALGSLPHRIGLEMGDPEEMEPHLAVDAGRAAALRARYAADGRPLVGISWHSRSSRTGRSKSLTLADWAPILAVPGLRFVSLQYGEAAGDIAAVREQTGIEILADPEIDPVRDLEGAAAQTAAMDLVVSISNTTVHLAGALGVPVWSMLPKGPGLLWYWFAEGERSPWYPSLRLFRQPRRGDWAPVIEGVAAELRSWARAAPRR